MKKPVDNPATVYLSKWSEKSDTRRTMLGALNRVATLLGGESAETFAWHKLRYASVRAIPAKLRDAGLKVRTINKMLSAVRGVLEAAWRSGRLPNEEYQQIDLKNEKGRSRPSGRALSVEETNTIMESLNMMTTRDAAALVVMCACGLRRVEVVRLVREDYDRDSGRITALGKGDKDREVPIAPRWRKWVDAWWDTLKPGEEAFPITRRQVSTLVERFCQHQNLRRFTPHDLRRTFATRVCASSDIGIAQRLMGHTSSDVTAIYDRRGDEAENKAVEKL